MQLTLPDKSLVNFDEVSYRFTRIESIERPYQPLQISTSKEISYNGFDYPLVASLMQEPLWRFGDSFRRTGDKPSYAPIKSIHLFIPITLEDLYDFDGYYYSNMFCASEKSRTFLDGQIYRFDPYGWGRQSYTVIEGFEVLRVVCLFFGIMQPKSIKGEVIRRPLATILEELSSIPLRRDKK